MITDGQGTEELALAAVRDKGGRDLCTQQILSWSASVRFTDGNSSILKVVAGASSDRTKPVGFVTDVLLTSASRGIYFDGVDASPGRKFDRPYGSLCARR